MLKINKESIDLYTEKGRGKSKLYPMRCTSTTEPFGKYSITMLAGNRAKAIFIPRVIARSFQNLKNIYLAVCVLTGFRRSKSAARVHYGDPASDIHAPLSLNPFENKCIFLVLRVRKFRHLRQFGLCRS